jgi:acrylyl-CoA reductase (NADPH)
MDFKALLLKQENNSLKASIEQLNETNLPQGDVLVEVHYSSLNYKDAMAFGNKGIIRKFPVVPGIDLSGIVVESNSAKFKSGDSVVLTGWGIGEKHWGGYTQMTRVKSEWLTLLPNGLSLKMAMQIGTAGLTAMLSVMTLEKNGIEPSSGDVLVTGASGGVGSIAIALLARKGYHVTALTGHLENTDYLKSLGAATVLDRQSFLIHKRPGRFSMETETYAGVIDTVGGQVLAAALSRAKYGSCVAMCGLVGGTDVDTSVFPFILRAIKLIGIDSVMCPSDVRELAWRRIVEEMPKEIIERATIEITLGQIPMYAQKMLEGTARGRTIVQVIESQLEE